MNEKYTCKEFDIVLSIDKGQILSNFTPSDFNIHEEEYYVAPEDEILKVMEE